MQDKAAFAKFQANVKIIADANTKNPKYFSALNRYSYLTWAEFQSKILLKVDPKKMQDAINK